eukprot:CAMPEP_0171353888 /NCGR_PEP_ID=MMETSP0878-20121228/44424_1 /TAXON_ID=67004 /ORGANISM="Thalassiosira weissflogii, Strain CCMP1336" /LENGTH=905 /DNA_ID=CAMNT_0011859845 /DNA_START=107 /DNA_END=2824 /DNA_ORIENTATION=-
MMDSKRLHLLGWTLLFSAASKANAQDLVQICGSDYFDAVNNCNTNTRCPSGDGCPPEQSTCYALPQSSCPEAVDPDDGLGVVGDGSEVVEGGLTETSNSTTSVPTASPSMNVTEYHVCAFNFQDAIDNCQTNTPCPDFDIRLCPATTACFAVPREQCPQGTMGGDLGIENTTDITTAAPTPAGTPKDVPESYKVCANDFDSAMAGCPFILPECTGSDCDVGEACFEVPAIMCLNATATPTESPTPEFLYVCGQNYTDASTNCREYTQCPTGDGCAVGTCFAIPYTMCPDEEPITSPIAGSTESPSENPEVGTDVPTISPSKSPTPNTFFCGETYQDAEQNCFTATPCPNGSGCPAGESCYGIAIPKCVSASPTAAPTDSGPQPTDSPTLSSKPTSAPVIKTAEPSKAPTPNTFFCGETYQDAEQNCFTATPCPNGSGCPAGESCYGIAIPKCVSASPTAAPTDSGPQPTDSPTLSPKPTSAPVIKTAEPSKAPTPNTLFCGVTYQDAEQNCFTATPCPNGSGCPAGEACFGISIPKCVSAAPTVAPTNPGPQPTDSPTVSPMPSVAATTIAPTTPQTPAPTASPIVNQNFCGMDYFDAAENCESRTPCPDGISCPSGQTCFPGITCAALAVPSGTPSPSVNDSVGGAATSAPSVSKGSGGPTSSAMPSPINGTSSMPSSNSTEMTPSPTPALRFCGTDPDDAKNNCAVNLPCPQGVECPVGQACFPLAEPCQPKSNETITPSPLNVTVSTPTNKTTLPPVAPGEVSSNGTVAPTLRPTSKLLFDPSVTNFCGTGWDDTVANCFYQQQCPSGETSECPDGLTCFVGIVGCKIPPTMAPTRTPGSVTGGENETIAVGTSPPTIRRTPPPTFDWTAIPPSGARGIWGEGLLNIASVGSSLVIALTMLW